MYIPGPNKFGKPFGKEPPVTTGPGPTKICNIPAPTGSDLIVAVTGHRPDKLGGYGEKNPIKLAIMEKLREGLSLLKPKAVITGMALGVDQWTAEVCIEKDIPFFAAIPCISQESRWPEASRLKYHQLLKKAYGSAIITNTTYASGVMQERNKWMVNNCHILIAVYDGTSGGTGNCVAYAQKVGRYITFIDIPQQAAVPVPTLPLDTKKPSEFGPITKNSILQGKASSVIMGKLLFDIFAENTLGELPTSIPAKKITKSYYNGKIVAEEPATEPFGRLVDLD